jgi:hypothetical protein
MDSIGGTETTFLKEFGAMARSATKEFSFKRKSLIYFDYFIFILT